MSVMLRVKGASHVRRIIVVETILTFFGGANTPTCSTQYIATRHTELMVESSMQIEEMANLVLSTELAHSVFLLHRMLHTPQQNCCSFLMLRHIALMFYLHHAFE